jgi:hypothetical protein
MQSALATFLDKGEVRVTLIYDEYDSGIRGMDAYQRLLHAFGEEIFQLRLWKFEPLRIQEICIEAASEARTSDLVLISLRTDRPLSSEVFSWVEAWNGKRESTGAMALILHSEGFNFDHFQVSQDFFRSVAAENGMAFFLVDDQDPSKATHFLHLSDLERIAPAGTHWGLDE